VCRMAAVTAPKRDVEGSKSPSTGPLPTPSGGRGLSPGPTGSTDSAKYAIEHSWAALEEDSRAPRSLGGIEGLLWVVDSGASRHMTYYKEAFIKYSALQEPITILTANGTKLQAIGQGTVVLRVLRNGVVTSLIAVVCAHRLHFSETHPPNPPKTP
jgi:hypothetical protein